MGREIEMYTLSQHSKCGIYLKRKFYFVRNFSMSSLLGYGSLMQQSKVEGLTLFRDANQESVDTVLVTVAH
jgi:hypothetical protein